MARKPSRTGKTTIYWLGEEENLSESGQPLYVPLDFLADLPKDLIQQPNFEIKVKGTAVCYYRRNALDYTFVAATLSPRQSKMIYG